MVDEQHLHIGVIVVQVAKDIVQSLTLLRHQWFCLTCRHTGVGQILLNAVYILDSFNK